MDQYVKEMKQILAYFYLAFCLISLLSNTFHIEDTQLLIENCSTQCQLMVHERYLRCLSSNKMDDQIENISNISSSRTHRVSSWIFSYFTQALQVNIRLLPLSIFRIDRTYPQTKTLNLILTVATWLVPFWERALGFSQ